LHIGRGYAQRSPQLLALPHPTADTVGPAQQLLNLGKLRLLQQLANTGTADALAALAQGAGIADPKTQALAEPFQQGKITGAITAKTKIVAHHQVADTQPLHQYFF